MISLHEHLSQQFFFSLAISTRCSLRPVTEIFSLFCFSSKLSSSFHPPHFLPTSYSLISLRSRCGCFEMYSEKRTRHIGMRDLWVETPTTFRGASTRTRRPIRPTKYGMTFAMRFYSTGRKSLKKKIFYLFFSLHFQDAYFSIPIAFLLDFIHREFSFRCIRLQRIFIYSFFLYFMCFQPSCLSLKICWASKTRNSPLTAFVKFRRACTVSIFSIGCDVCNFRASIEPGKAECRPYSDCSRFQTVSNRTDFTNLFICTHSRNQ